MRRRLATVSATGRRSESSWIRGVDGSADRAASSVVGRAAELPNEGAKNKTPLEVIASMSSAFLAIVRLIIISVATSLRGFPKLALARIAAVFDAKTAVLVGQSG